MTVSSGVRSTMLYKRKLQWLLVGGGGTMVAGAALFYAIHSGNQKRRKKFAFSASGSIGDGPKQGDGKKEKKSQKKKGRLLQKLLPMLCRLVGPRLLVVLGLAVGRTLLSNRLAKLQGYLFRAAFLRRIPLFVRNISENVLLCAMAAGLESTAKMWMSGIELTWRDVLTKRLHSRYFEDMNYYKINYVDRRIDSPEQRMCEDVPRLTMGLAELLQEVVGAMVDAGFYSYQLKRYSGTHGYTLGVLGYVLGVGTFMTVAAPNFGRMIKKQQVLEGSYVGLHHRLKDNCEAVAFYNGTEKEGSVIMNKYKDLVEHTKRVLGKQWRFSMVQDFLLKYLGATVAVALIIGPFFAGHLRPEATISGRAQMLSNMRYHTSVIISLFGALGTLGTSSRKILKLNAFADRIEETIDVMKDISAGRGTGGISDAHGLVESSEDSIEFYGATVVTPGNATLVHDLSLKLPQGVNLLVTGPNGAGKSSLFRVLGGLWPLHQGTIKKPGLSIGETGLSHEIFYVPQRPYVAAGTLQEQLLYPLSPSDERRIPDDDLRQLLHSVDLEHLLERAGDGETDWGNVLSLGEQQRLGMARLFYHKPRFAILDECTSGVSVEMEERFCNAVKDMGCTCITISHRPALMAFHDIVLNLDGEGGWTLHQGHRATSPEVVQTLSNHGIALDSLGGHEQAASVGSKVRHKDVQEVLDGMMHEVKKEQVQNEIEVYDGDEEFSERLVSYSPDKVTMSSVIWRGIVRRQTNISEKWISLFRIILGKHPSDSAMKMLTVSGVVILRTLLQDRIAKLNGRSVDLVLRQDLKGFILLIGQSILQSTASAFLAPSLKHVAEMLALTWRTRITEAISKKYLAKYTPYTVAKLEGVGDVDQRITRDVLRLSEDLASLVPTLVKPVADIAWFSYQLWDLTGPRGAAILYSYAIIGYGCLRMVTPDFSALLDGQYKLEATFRGAHERLKTHAESIAFFGGGEREGQKIAKSYKNLEHHLKHLIRTRWSYEAADDFFAKQLPHSVTWVLTLLYALDQRSEFGDSAFQGQLVLQIRYLASVVTQCFSAFGELLALPRRFAEISGGVRRVSEALEVIELSYALNVQTEERLAMETSNKIIFDHVDVVSPNRNIMARKLTFSLPEGKSLLVSGPNGCGKTSIFRLLAGLWPQGDGRICSPGRLNGKGVYYVAQKPYTTVGTLRDQVIYPLTCEEAVTAFGGNLELLDIHLDKLVSVVRLKYLINREGGWDTEKSWGDVLSLGEQQRLGMARVFFHKPIFAVLDACTNAMSVDVEESLYKYAAGELGINIITITQRTALVKYHDMELRLLDGDGAWELRHIKHK